MNLSAFDGYLIGTAVFDMAVYKVGSGVEFIRKKYGSHRIHCPVTYAQTAASLISESISPTILRLAPAEMGIFRIN